MTTGNGGKVGNGCNGRRVEGWKALLQKLLDEHNHYYKENGRSRRTVSHATRDKRAKVLFHCFYTLRDKLGYRIEDPKNLRPKHVEALVKFWEQERLSASTIQSRLSFLRAFVGWIDKPGMITASVNYLADPNSAKRSYAADRDKGWEANGIDIREKILEIAISEPYVAMQLKIASTFGMRRKEAVMLVPHDADEGDNLVVERGAKGGRLRAVKIDTAGKRAVLEETKAFVIAHGGGKGGHIGDPGKNLKQNLSKYSNTMTKFGITMKAAGVTGHGLRHQFACDRLAEQGVIAPVRGGQPDQMSREDRTVAYKKVSEEMGHSRESVIAAYAGRFIRNRRASKSEKPTELEMSPVYEDGEG